MNYEPAMYTKITMCPKLDMHVSIVLSGLFDFVATQPLLAGLLNQFPLALLHGED